MNKRKSEDKKGLYSNFKLIEKIQERRYFRNLYENRKSKKNRKNKSGGRCDSGVSAGGKHLSGLWRGTGKSGTDNRREQGGRRRRNAGDACRCTDTKSRRTAESAGIGAGWHFAGIFRFPVSS